GAEVEFAVLHVAQVAGVEDLDLVDVTLAVLDLPGLLAALLEPLPVLVPEHPATRVLWVVDVEDAVLTQSSSPRSGRSARPRRGASRPGRRTRRWCRCSGRTRGGECRRRHHRYHHRRR